MKSVTKRKILFVFYCLIALILIMTYKPDNVMLNFLRIQAVEILAPTMDKISQAIYFIGDFADNSKNFFLTFQENKKLRERNDFLEYYFYRYKQIQEENEELKRELNVKEEVVSRYITARVIAKNNNFTHQELILNVGSKHGIKKWQMVLSRNHLVGRIISVGANTSSLLLITDHSSRIPVMGITSKVKCIATGQMTNNLACNYISDEKPIENELAVTSYDNDSIIANIIIGTIFKNQGNYYIKPNINLNKLEFVQILEFPNE